MFPFPACSLRTALEATNKPGKWGVQVSHKGWGATGMPLGWGGGGEVWRETQGAGRSYLSRLTCYLPCLPPRLGPLSLGPPPAPQIPAHPTLQYPDYLWMPALSWGSRQRRGTCLPGCCYCCCYSLGWKSTSKSRDTGVVGELQELVELKGDSGGGEGRGQGGAQIRQRGEEQGEILTFQSSRTMLALMCWLFQTWANTSTNQCMRSFKCNKPLDQAHHFLLNLSTLDTCMIRLLDWPNCN